MFKVACNHVPAHIKELRQILGSFAQADYVEWDRKQIIENIGEYHAFIPSISIRIDNEVYDAARNLKVIATASTGTDHIDLQEAARRGIAVLSIKNDIEFLRGVTSTAEQALALMLSVVRMIPSSFDSVKQGRWQSASFRGHMLSGKTLGIIGFGRLGEIMAGYGNALKMKVLVADPYKIVHVNYVEQVSLEKLLERSDIFSLHVHLNDETRGMIGKNQINMMKDGAVIVNTSRGAIIDEMAMVEALESEKLGGAGLDVLATELYEDISKSPVVQYARKHDNVVISPHVGGVTYESQEMAYAKIATKLKDWLEAARTK